MAATIAMAAESDARFALFPAYEGSDLELLVDSSGTHFTLWSPEAEAAQVLLYPTDRNSAAEDTLAMLRAESGTWRASVPSRLYGKFYTFRVKHAGRWLDETPGVWAKAVGTNGKRAAIIDFAGTNPDGWNEDRGPEVKT